MIGIALLVAVTLLYAGYNLLIKVSGAYVPDAATTTILATICLQLAALLTSALFLGILVLRGGHVFSLSPGSYIWAALAGICIGGAEIGYLYLFGGVGLVKPMAAAVAIPTIVSGTIVIALLFSFLLLEEEINWNQILGCLLIVLGIATVFFRKSV
jgi:drug/metabolite transporter (DMT)-like permease